MASSVELDQRLLQAVEIGDADAARGALAAGASPDTCRTLTLSVEWRQGVFGMGSVEQRKQTVEGESAAVLAVLMGRAEVAELIVAELVRRGRGQGGQVVWRVNGYWDRWDRDCWERRRWMVVSCPSLLLLALGTAITVSFEDGTDPLRDLRTHARTFKIPCNPPSSPPGRHSYMRNPTVAYFVVSKFSVSVEVVAAVARAGVPVTQEALDAAAALPDPAVRRAALDVLMAQREVQKCETPNSVGPALGALNGPHPHAGHHLSDTELAHERRVSARLREERDAARDRIADLEAHVAALEGQVAAREAQVAALEWHLAARVAQVAGLVGAFAAWVPAWAWHGGLGGEHPPDAPVIEAEVRTGPSSVVELPGAESVSVDWDDERMAPEAGGRLGSRLSM